ncbi:MAG: ribokinase [Ruminococcaceae bacterium]|nr:ribokinase [Oscillospiraceae bacterium]
MKFICFGSLNIDHVYAVDDFVKAGMTVSSTGYTRHAGGKGLNQTVALAKARSSKSGINGIYMAGKISRDGAFLVDILKEAGVNCDHIMIDDNAPTGHAVIQVNREGENCIIVYPGANALVTNEEVDRILENFEAGDYLFLQNEINATEYLIRAAHAKQLITVLTPSPFSKELVESPVLSIVDWIVLNETEIQFITGEKYPAKALKKMAKMYPQAKVLLTLGENGSRCYDGNETIDCIAYSVAHTVDTTGAGDAYTGYFFTNLCEGTSVYTAMKRASLAAGITVSRAGAANSIPSSEELESFLNEFHSGV